MCVCVRARQLFFSFFAYTNHKGQPKKCACFNMIPRGTTQNNRPPISSEMRRPALHRKRATVVGGGEKSSNGEMASKNKTTPMAVAELGLSSEMHPHVVKKPPPIKSPRSACGLSRSQVEKAMQLAALKKSVVAKQRMQNKKGGVSSAMAVNFKKNYKNKPRPALLPSKVGEGGNDFSPVNKMRPKVQHQQIKRSRKASMEAPARPSIAKNMLTDMNFYKELKSDVVTNDLSQFRMVEIEPPFNKSSRSAHFVAQGYAQYRQNNLINAVNIFTKAIEANDRNWLGYFWRGLIFDKLGGYVRAINDLTTSIKVKSRLAVEEAGDAPPKHHSLDSSSRSKKGGGDLVEEPIELASIYFNRGIVYCHIGDDKSAEKDFSSALKRDPGNFVFRHNRALVNRRFGNYTEAQGDYVKLWMERKVLSVENSPCETNMRPVSMSGFRKKSKRESGGGNGYGSNGLLAIQEYIRELKAQEQRKSERLGIGPNGEVLKSPSHKSALSAAKAAKVNQSPDNFGDRTFNEEGSSIADETNLQSLSFGHFSTASSGKRLDDECETMEARNLFDTMDDEGSSSSLGKIPSIVQGDSGFNKVSIDGTMAELSIQSADDGTELQTTSLVSLKNGDAATVVRQREFQSPNNSKPMTSGSIISTQSPLTPLPQPRPHTTSSATCDRTSNRLSLSASKFDRIPSHTPSDRAIHAMDSRQLTDFFFGITGVKKEREQGHVTLNRTKKGSKKLLDTRMDLNEFKNQIGLGKGDVYEELFNKPSNIQVSYSGEREASLLMCSPLAHFCLSLAHALQLTRHKNLPAACAAQGT